MRALVAKTKRVRKTVKLRKNGKHKVDAASTIRAPIGLGLQRILRGQAQFRWLGPQLAAITPQYIEATLTGAMAGAHVQQWWLFDLMLKTWPELLACYTELIYGVLRKKMIFEPHHDEDEKPTPGSDERLKVVCAALMSMSPDPTRDESAMEGTIKDILDAWFRGLGVQEIVWQMVDDPVVGTIAAPKSTFSIDVSNYAFSNEGVLGLRSDKGRAAATWPYQTTSMQPLPSDLVPFPPNKFLIAKAKCSAGNTVAGALLRPLAWWWCAANFSSDWLLNLAQVFGLPFRWANYDTNAPQATIDAICNMLQNMGSAGWAAFPVGTTLEMISPSASQGSDHSPQGELLDRADRYARNLLLGQTMTGTHGTTGKGGGQAFGEVEADVKSDRIDAAGKFAEQIINDQLIKFILALNYGDTDEAPTVRFLEDEEAGYNEAQRDKLLVDAGLPIGMDFMRKKYGIPEPAEGEETLEKAEPPPGFGAPNDKKAPPEDLNAKLQRISEIKDDALFAQALSAIAAATVGDKPGHPFRGNQYTDVEETNHWQHEIAPEWEGVKRHAKYVRKANSSHLVTVSPSTTKADWSRVNYWDRRGIVSHLEVPNERIDKVLRQEAYPRGHKVLVIEGGIGGSYPSANYAGFGAYADSTSAKGGVKTFVAPKDAVDWMKSRLESGGYKVRVKDVTETL